MPQVQVTWLPRLHTNHATSTSHVVTKVTYQSCHKYKSRGYQGYIPIMSQVQVTWLPRLHTNHATSTSHVVTKVTYQSCHKYKSSGYQGYIPIMPQVQVTWLPRLHTNHARVKGGKPRLIKELRDLCCFSRTRCPNNHNHIMLLDCFYNYLKR